MSQPTRHINPLKSGEISRRAFVERAIALGVSVGLARSSEALAAAGPKNGGTFRCGLAEGAATNTLDPATFSEEMDIYGCYTLRNHLTEVASTGEVIPELAESWDASPDATVWAFKLRDGVEFHNGKTLEAEDVAVSINHHRGDDSKSGAKNLLAPIKDIRVDGKSTVIFTLSSGNADFAFLMSDYHLPILPAKDGEADARSGVGTGPYVLRSFDPGVRLIGERNQNYWKTDRAHFDQVEFIRLRDVSSRTNALTTGEIHLMARCDLKTVSLLERNESLRVEELPSTFHHSAPMRVDTPPFDDNNVRLAVKHAVDREAWLRTILGGHGALGNDHPIARSNRYHAAELEQRQYDPDKAKFLLRKAGLSELKLELHTSDIAFVGAVDAAVLFKEHAAKAGIEIKVTRDPEDGYWEANWLKVPWMTSSSAGRPTEDWMFSTFYAAEAAWNETHWQDERFNKLLVEARAELDEARRREMYLEMQTLLRDEGGAVIPAFQNNVFASSREVEHTDVLGTHLGIDGAKVAERWWFA